MINFIKWNVWRAKFAACWLNSVGPYREGWTYSKLMRDFFDDGYPPQIALEEEISNWDYYV